MSRARRLGAGRVAAGLCAAWLMSALACTDVGVVGEASACSQPCTGALLCDTASRACVECLGDDDCSGDRQVCSTAHVCVQCLGAVDCQDGELCVMGACRTADNEPVSSTDGDGHEVDDHAGETDDAHEGGVDAGAADAAVPPHDDGDDS